jgi:hypothetical protein
MSSVDAEMDNLQVWIRRHYCNTRGDQLAVRVRARTSTECHELFARLTQPRICAVPLQHQAALAYKRNM